MGMNVMTLVKTSIIQWTRGSQTFSLACKEVKFDTLIVLPILFFLYLNTKAETGKTG
jgi:hypothetical protein